MFDFIYALGNSKFFCKILFIFIFVIVYPIVEIGVYADKLFLGFFIGLILGLYLFTKGFYER